MNTQHHHLLVSACAVELCVLLPAGAPRLLLSLLLCCPPSCWGACSKLPLLLSSLLPCLVRLGLLSPC